MDILEAIKTLDPDDDSLWTGEGLPRIDLIAKLVENPQLTRKEVTEAAPDFTRDRALELQAPDPPADATPDQPPVPPADVTPEDPPAPVDPVKDAQDKVLDAARAAEEANQIKLAAEEKMNEALAEKEKNEPLPHIANQRRIQDFLKSQHEQRKLRGANQARLRAVIGGLDTRAPVDRDPQKRRNT